MSRNSRPTRSDEYAFPEIMGGATRSVLGLFRVLRLFHASAVDRLANFSVPRREADLDQTLQEQCKYPGSKGKIGSGTAGTAGAAG